jgi:glycogen operon protein
LLRQPRFLHGEEVAKGVKNVIWLRADGAEMSPDDWANGLNRSVALQLADAKGHAILLVLNAYHEGVAFDVSDPPKGGRWRILVDTERAMATPSGNLLQHGKQLIVAGRSLTLLERSGA